MALLRRILDHRLEYKRAGVNRKYGAGFYTIRHTYATMIGTSSKDFREVQAALGQATIQQQEVYRHDRAIKARVAQERLRGDMQETGIGRILKVKLEESCSDDKLKKAL